MKYPRAYTSVDIGGLIIPEYRQYSPEFQTLYRRYRTRERLFAQFLARYETELALLRVSAFKRSPDNETTAARSTPRWKVIQADNAFGDPKAGKTSGFDWAPFQPIPNVRKFEVRPGPQNKLLKAFDINVRTQPEILFSFYKNQRMIRYAQHMIRRLRSTKSDKLYWTISKVILTRSIVFGVMALAKSFARFHRELPMSLVVRLVTGAHAIFRKQRTDLEHSRVYIPKGDSKWRPLGVPKPVWRVALTMLTWILITRYNSLVPAWQHGFRPKVGTLTAWKVVLLKVIKARYIYEFDLKGFFDSVPVARVVKFLVDRGLDPVIAHMIIAMSKRAPKLPEEQKLDETHEKAKTFWHDPKHRDSGLFTTETGRERSYDPPGGMDVDEWLDYYCDTNEEVRGFPQGVNFSPFLSIISLVIGGDPKFASLIMYADDGLFYSQRKFSASDVEGFFTALGLSIQPAKSGWIRENYKWVKPLKFLGLVYKPEADELWSDTRNGVAMKFDKKDLVMAVESVPVPMPQDDYLILGNPCMEYLLWSRLDPKDKQWFETAKAAREERSRREASGVSGQWSIARVTPDSVMLTSNIDSQFSWESLAKSRIWGLIQSRMFVGDWNTTVEQDFRLKYVPSSWVAKRGRPYSEELVFSNSTSFAFHDIVLLISNSRRNAQWKEQYKEGWISLEGLNRRRASIGYPPVSSWYSVSLKRQHSRLDPHVPLPKNWEEWWDCYSGTENAHLKPVQLPDWIRAKHLIHQTFGLWETIMHHHVYVDINKYPWAYRPWSGPNNRD